MSLRFFVTVSLVLLGIFISASFVDCQTSLDRQWTEYKKKFGKVYGVAEDSKRKSVYELHMAKVQAHNIRYENGAESYRLGETRFSDYLPDDWKHASQGSNPDIRANQSTVFHPLQTPPNIALAEAFNMGDVDHRIYGCVGPVKEQGSCSSSWTFATTGILEHCACQKSKCTARSSTNCYVPLSEQQLLDCATFPFYGKNLGCLGGSVGPSLDYAENFGLLSSQSYPYTAKFGFCDALKVFFTPSAARVAKKGIFRLDGDETAIANIVKKQPVAAVITTNPENFANYKGGIYDDPKCTVTQTNRPCYAVMIVGFGKQKKSYCQGGVAGDVRDGVRPDCPSGTSPDPKGKCCADSQKDGNGGCCPNGLVVSNGVCCPSGNEGDNKGNCCPPGHKDQTTGNCIDTTTKTSTTKPICNNPLDYDYYWTVKTSFGPSWGEGGYMKLRRGVNMCGIAYDVHYITC